LLTERDAGARRGAAPDSGANIFLRHGALIAQVGRNAKRRDNEDWLGPKGEHAVPEGDAP
jgi:hypothetical protein